MDVTPTARHATFRSLWTELEPVGRDLRSGGYARFAWTRAETELREWFTAAAQERGLEVETDRNGNLWAWWGSPGPDAVVTGSHLDSVPSGGAYDGPLGVVSAFLALDELRRRGVGGASGGASGGGRPPRPFAIACFVEEEGARFGIACLGSRLMTGALDADAARRLTDADGVTLAEAVAGGGLEAARLGRDEETLRRIGIFVELHVEQGRALVDLGAPVGVGTSIWPHGRYRFDFAGLADHAGTTRMEDRHDPMLTYAMTALAANKQARLAGAAGGGARATFGRVEVAPNGTNAIPSHVTAWLDARCSTEAGLAALVGAIEKQAAERADRDGTTLAVTAESVSPAVAFPPELAARIAGSHSGGDWPLLPTQAGHDAGILSAAGVPSAMLFVRNPTGVSHSPEEYAEDADCIAGAVALADTLERLLVGSGS